jgi:ribonuclease E
MLIDATHPEETRVVVLRGNRVEEFDFESASRRQLRGNIYLAKVTRVEPSLQAAFVEYGGNRHGFLAFSEIHPDYYQIPVADRQALIAEEERAQRAAEAEMERQVARPARGRALAAVAPRGEALAAEEEAPEPPASSSDEAPPEISPEIAAQGEETDIVAEPRRAADRSTEAAIESPDALPIAAEARTEREPASDVEGQPAIGLEQSRTAEGEAAAEDSADNGSTATTQGDGEEAEVEEDAVEVVGGDDALDEATERLPRLRRRYKIQEVIKRRQIMLVQVVKEERGSKGAALTTYLSLAGRYAVLMPNTARGGGISRKITNPADRKRLKEIAQELDVPPGMGVILRTAGANRTKAEIKRDFEYLLRVWENVRELTLKSTAPKLVYEEGSLIKRAIRDLYTKDIDEVLVAGEEAYKEARDFMRTLMPSHVKNVKLYRDAQPIFTRYNVESQLDAMFSPVVQLKSGGYIVLNQAEALVAIDVNSGRATREHHIEDTALKTNLEAAEEIARQLRLRDLAGLIVIDFIDMDEKRNNRAVERRLKECLKQDRARIQVGRISHFGLLEMSRQRIRSSVLESLTEKCPHCGGLGHVRSVSSVALQIVRALEEMLIKGATHNLTVRTRTDVALYVLNHKRAHLTELETRFGVTIRINADPAVGGLQPFVIERAEQVRTPEEAKALIERSAAAAKEIAEEEPEAEEKEEQEADAFEAAGAELGSADEDSAADVVPADGEGQRARRRRRRPEPVEKETAAAAVGDDADGEAREMDRPAGEGTALELAEESSAEGARERRRRRRGRRGGRRHRRHAGAHALAAESEPGAEALTPASDERLEVSRAEHEEPTPPAGAADAGDASGPTAATEETSRESSAASEVPPPQIEVSPEAPRRRSTVREPVALVLRGGEGSVPPPVPRAEPELETSGPDQPDQPRRTGWWTRRLMGIRR